MDKKQIERPNEAIEKVETISKNLPENKKVTEIKTEQNRVDGVSVENTTEIKVDYNELNKHKKIKQKLREKDKKERAIKAKKDRITAEKQAKLKLKEEKHAEKMKLKRLKEEKRSELKRQRAEEKAYLKQVKTEQAHEHRQKRADRREKRKESRRNRGIGGWLTAVISLGCTVLILGSLLTLSLFTDYLEFGKVNTASSTSQRAFYDFVGYIDNIETNMSKVFVSNGKEGQQKLLSEITLQSNLADTALGQLPIMDESKYLTSRYINQLGDYTKYLNNRLIYGHSITDNEYKNLQELYRVNQNLKDVLTSLSASINENYDFSMLSKNDANDKIISQFKEVEQNTMDYPEMIYDGAFSDGVQGKKARGIFGKEITELEAKEIFAKIFNSYGVEKIEVSGMVENEEIVCYNLISKTKTNGEVFAQISKVGGKLVMFNAYKDCKGEDVSEAECVKIAEDFLQSLGIENMLCVWNYSSGSTQYLNFVYDKGGIITYPDMIKVKVCKERGVVSGIDADNYYMNHRERSINEPKFTLSDAYDKVSDKLEIRSSAVTVIPTGGGNEVLAYEFIGESNEQTYYVYLDANTLQELDIFKVVNTSEGRLLI